MISIPKQGIRPSLGKKSLLGALVAIFIALSGAEGTRFNFRAYEIPEEHHERLTRPAVKSIMSEDGDIVDCVDIYNQPAFDHPLLKNHTIEMRPSFTPKMEGNSTFNFPVQQSWQKNGRCPEGTVPIQRIRATGLNNINGSSRNIGLNGEFSECKVEVARIELHRDGPYIGAQGKINVWDLPVEPKEWSLNSVTVFNEDDSFFESGWAVSPILWGDSRPRNFINWMDTSTGQGCFNLRCPGFVQVSNNIMLGGQIPNVSQYEGEQFAFTFVTYKDAVQGKWWVTFEGEAVGYWPLILVPNFQGGPRINWGGSTCNTQPKGFHTLSQMGSGHFGREGYKRASHIRNILAMNKNKKFVIPSHYKFSASYRGCYTVEGCDAFPDDVGPCIYYGGPGGKCCDARC